MLPSNLSRLFFFGLIGYLFVLFFSKVGSAIILPFGVSFIFAYILSGLVSNIVSKRKKYSRSTVSAIVSISTTFVLIVLSLLLLPFLFKQISLFAEHLPQAIDFLSLKYKNLSQYIKSSPTLSMLISESELPDNPISLLPDTLFSVKTISNILDYKSIVSNIISLVLLFPIITFYMLRDWNVMSTKFFQMIPIKYQIIARNIASEVREKLSASFYGQFKIAIVLTIYYSVFFVIFRVKFGLLLGVLSGIFSIIPIIGICASLLIGIAIILSSSSATATLDIVTLVSIITIGQILEGNFVTPRLVGNNVGIHPIWIIFGFLCGGAIAGFAGVIFALPLTAITSVLVRSGVKMYKHSEYYSK